MTLAVLKHRGQWDWLGRMFQIEGSTFERHVTRFISLLSDKLYEIYVEMWNDD